MSRIAAAVLAVLVCLGPCASSGVAAPPQVSWISNVAGSVDRKRGPDTGSGMVSVPTPLQSNAIIPPRVATDEQELIWAGPTDGPENAIILTDMNGGSVRTIFSSTYVYVSNAEISPDEQYVYFESAPLNTNDSHIWRMPLYDGIHFPTVFIASPGATQRHISFSADGSKIAFLSGPPGASNLYTANGDGTGVTQVPVPSTVGSRINEAEISPNGQKIALTGRTSTSGSKYDLYTINVNGTGLTNRTNTSSAKELEMDWSPDGSKIIFNAGGTGASGTNLMKTIPAASGTATTIASVATNGELRHPTYRTARSVNNWDQLLSRYAPRLQYDHGDLWYADSAAVLTDAPNNVLRRGSTVLAGHGIPGVPELYLDYLGDIAGSSLDTDTIDQRDDPSPADVAAQFHADGGYANRMYGRAKQDASGKWWLQYWFSYFYNDVSDINFGGAHEGDWEMMQIGFTGGGVPDAVTFAQHSTGMRCTWDQANRFFSGTSPGTNGPTVSPIGYVAAYSHATYPRNGVYLPSIDFDHLYADYARGDDAVNSTIPMTDSITDPPTWLDWAGKWGNTDTSPRGPMFQGLKWSNPGSWSAGVGSCDLNPASGASVERDRTKRRLTRGAQKRLAPPTPHVRASATQKGVSVSYRLPGEFGARAKVFVTLEASDGTKTQRKVAARATATLRLRWPSARRAGELFVEAIGSRGIPSPTVKRPVAVRR